MRGLDGGVRVMDISHVAVKNAAVRSVAVENVAVGVLEPMFCP